MYVNKIIGEKSVIDYCFNLQKIRMLLSHQVFLTLAGYYTVDREVIRHETDKTKYFCPLTCLHYHTDQIHR